MPPIRGSVTRYILIGAGIVIVVVVVAAFIYTRRASKVNKGRVIASVLNADEKRIVDIISASGTGALQKHVVKESGFSKAKVSRLVKSLGSRNIVKIEPVSGRENRILLSGGARDKERSVVKNEEEPKQTEVAEGNGHGKDKQAA
jgi:uncharacterized membrane protein